MRVLTVSSVLCLASLAWGQSKPEFASSSPIANVGGGMLEFAPGSLIYVLSLIHISQEVVGSLNPASHRLCAPGALGLSPMNAFGLGSAK